MFINVALAVYYGVLLHNKLRPSVGQCSLFFVQQQCLRTCVVVLVDVYFLPVACFLLFNVCDVLGRLLSGVFLWVSPRRVLIYNVLQGALNNSSKVANNNVIMPQL